jgi:hypothetical protein
MSSCSEYLVRQQLRAQKFTDTRPKMTCGQMTEIQRQRAASAVYETFLPATACLGSTTTIGKKHHVQDASTFTTYASSQAAAAIPLVKSTPQIQSVCYGPTLVTSQNGVAPSIYINQIPEVQDRILLSGLLATTDVNYLKEDRIAKARQSIRNCCEKCGKVNRSNRCECKVLT